MKVDLKEVPEFYHNYIQLAAQYNNLKEAFTAHTTKLSVLLENLSEEKWKYKYADGKWSIKELVQHIIDSERIFAYRALCFARKDATPLPGFDENDYAAASNADERSGNEILTELKIVLQSTALLFASLTSDQLNAKGVANGASISVSAIGWITVGHVLHHINILNERYL